MRFRFFSGRLGVHSGNRWCRRDFASERPVRFRFFSGRLGVHPRDRRCGRDFARKRPVRFRFFSGRLGVHPGNRWCRRDFARERPVRFRFFPSRLGVHAGNRRCGRDFASERSVWCSFFHPGNRRCGRDFARERPVWCSFFHPRNWWCCWNRPSERRMDRCTPLHARNRRSWRNGPRKYRRGWRIRGDLSAAVLKRAVGHIIWNRAITFGAKFHLPTSIKRRNFRVPGLESVFKEAIFLFQHFT